METNTELVDVYDDYYADGKVAEKRRRTAIQTCNHIEAIMGARRVSSVLDIGAGDGAVLAEMSNRNFAAEYSAVEISSSGIDAIQKRQLTGLKSVLPFDGYKIPHANQQFDLGLAIHVLEHVEHERLFLREAARVCKQIFVEVPLEHTSKLTKAIQSSSKYGHINFYTIETFENVLKTSGLVIDKIVVYYYDLAFEQFISGRAKGWLKFQFRKHLYQFVPKTALRHVHYMAGALCSGGGRIWE